MDHLTCLGHTGTGATAYVFKAADSAGQFYAVKIRKPATTSTTATEDACGSMEEKFLQTISPHANIVKLHKCATGPLPDAFIALLPDGERAPFMKMLRGTQKRRSVNGLLMDYHHETLFQAVERVRADNETYLWVIVRALRGLLSAAEHMLSKGVLHLDLKADNVLTDAQGEPVVIDFSHALFSALRQFLQVQPRRCQSA